MVAGILHTYRGIAQTRFPITKEPVMSVAVQGSLALLNDPVAQTLLQSAIPARLAYVWHDGTPRVVPIWFQWTGEEVVMAGPVDAPKMKALKAHPAVALTIDDTMWPYKTLMIRGTAQTAIVDGMIPEYAQAAERYFGPEEGEKWVAGIAATSDRMVRIAVRPEWVGIIDFETRFPSAIARHMG
jgi:nitroimidazol reductase NimA-like FMN-containing flavoprotein (pyridoxamine 5'-phosphate oxidase superfamily)